MIEIEIRRLLLMWPIIVNTGKGTDEINDLSVRGKRNTFEMGKDTEGKIGNDIETKCKESM